MLLAALLEAGAKAVCWSGAGPSLLGICVESSARDVRDAAAAAMGATVCLVTRSCCMPIAGEWSPAKPPASRWPDHRLRRGRDPPGRRCRPAPPRWPLFDFDEDG